MRKYRYLFFLLVFFLWLSSTVCGAEENQNVKVEYKSVKTDTLIVPFEDNEGVCFTSVYTLKKQVEEDDEFDYYLLENFMYFTKNGNSFTLSHTTNDANIIFEEASYSMNRLISNENKFITFFSGLNNFSKIDETIVESRNNYWSVKRAFYALDRYFDNSYTFKMQTKMKVPQDGEVRLYIELNGAFDVDTFDEYKQEIKYNAYKKK